MPAVMNAMWAPSREAADFVAVCIGGFLALFRLGAGAEAGFAERQLARRGIAAERLGIGIGGDELDAVNPFANHVLDGIAACATDAEHLDDGARFLFFDDLKHDYLL
jgi:hypothetical protein